MIDLAICLECTSSMASDLHRVYEMIISILIPVLKPNQEEIRLSLIEFGSRKRHDPWMTKIFTSIEDIKSLKQWFNDIEAFGGNEDECEAIGDTLQKALNVFQFFNDNNKKLVILITEGAPNGLFTLLDPYDRFGELNGADPWLVANEFKKQDVTLTVVGVEPSVIQCDDFYCALARKTGGHYIPLINAAVVLSSIILEKSTFYQTFLRVNMNYIEQNSLFKYSNVEQRVNDMISECKTMIDIRRLFYNHHNQFY